MEFTNLNLLTFSIFIWIIFFIWILFYKLYIKQVKFNQKFNLLSTWKYFYIKYVFLLLSLFLMLFASFWVKYWEKKLNNEVNWIDIMFILDVSKSMNVPDIVDSNYSYKRLDIIKESISKFVISNRENRFWLIIFAWDAVSTVPLTTDHDLFLTFLKWVDYRNLTKQGSNFYKALDLWIKRFNDTDDRSKALIFISDWWDSEDNINKSTLKNIIKDIKWITYFVVWVWTNKWWNIISGRDAFGRYIFQKYEWEYVVSKINRLNLKNIAWVLKADYVEVKNIWDLLKLNKKINDLEKKVIEKSGNWELWDFWRNISILSFMFFLFFLMIYLGEGKFIFIKKNNE